MAGKRKRDQAAGNGTPTAPKAKPPLTVGDFVVMPLQYPAACNLPATVHYMYLRAHSGTQELPKGRTLFVVNIPPDAGDRELRGLFSHYGVIEKVSVRGEIAGTAEEESEEDGMDEEGQAAEEDETEDDEEESDEDRAMPAAKRRKRPPEKDPAPIVTPLPPLPPRPHETSSSAHIVFLDASSVTRALRPPSSPTPYTPPPLSGLAYYLSLHSALHPPLPLVRSHADTAVEAYDHARALAHKPAPYRKGEVIVDEDGFTLVTRGGKYGQTKGGGVGVASKAFELAVSGKAAEGERRGRRGKKKKNTAEGMPDFYRFQQREKKRQKFMELREQFQKDKDAVAKLRESRRFKPY